MKTIIDYQPTYIYPRTPFLSLSLCIGLLSLVGCNKPDETAAKVSSTTASTTEGPTAVVPLATETVSTVPVSTTMNTSVAITAEELYQMVAPIALYPDKMVAQILAGATYPEQVTTAQDWLTLNPKLKAGQLADAVSQQSWDPSIKSLTAFRPVVAQMAGNLPWTTALGQAYYNNPSDVLNAVQVMRQRAAKAGTLKSNPKQRIITTPTPVYTAGPASTTVVVQRPREYISIEPAQSDLVYVPDYNPRGMYGRDAEQYDEYPGYRYRSNQNYDPQYGYRQDVQPDRNAALATTGVLGFGTGVVVGSALERHGWGWHSWDTDWRGQNDGEKRGEKNIRRRDRGPAVVYNNAVYESRSNTVVDRYSDRHTRPSRAELSNSQQSNFSHQWTDQQWREQQRADWKKAELITKAEQVKQAELAYQKQAQERLQAAQVAKAEQVKQAELAYQKQAQERLKAQQVTKAEQVKQAEQAYQKEAQERLQAQQATKAEQVKQAELAYQKQVQERLKAEQTAKAEQLKQNDLVRPQPAQERQKAELIAKAEQRKQAQLVYLQQAEERKKAALAASTKRKQAELLYQQAQERRQVQQAALEQRLREARPKVNELKPAS